MVLVKSDTTDQSTPGLEAFEAFSDKHWNGKATVLQYIITAHLFAENTIDERLKVLFPHDDGITKLTFSNKVTLFKSAGLHDGAIDKLTHLNKVRNKYAHNLDYSITWNDVKELSNKKKHTLKEWKEDQEGMLTRVLTYSLGYIYGSMMHFEISSGYNFPKE